MLRSHKESGHEGGLLRRICRLALMSGLAAALTVSVLYTADLDSLSFWRNRAKIPDSPVAAAAHGGESVVRPSPIGTDSSVSSTRRALLLAGTHPGQNLHDGHADIGLTHVSPQRYRVGALLANGARLTEIYSDHVILERDGLRAALYTDGREQAQPEAAPLKELLTVGYRATKSSNASSSDALTDHVRVSPRYKGDRLESLEVYPAANSQAFYAMGLRDGDRIQLIDNEHLNDVSSAVGALRSLFSNARTVSVIVERNGAQIPLSLSGAAVRSIGGSTESQQGVSQ